jgi:hypothetical protein
MHIESVPNRKSHPTILLRESYRADGKVKKRTIANLTNWPEPLVEGLRTLLRGGVALPTADEALTISRSLPHGHVAAVLGTAEQVGLPKLLSERRGGSASRRYRDLVMALIVNRVIAPASKLATVRALNPRTALRFAGAPRPGLLPPRKQKVQINPGLSFRLDEKRGARQVVPRAMNDRPTSCLTFLLKRNYTG